LKDSLDILSTYNEPEKLDETPVEYVSHDALNILRTDVICHHGILGMKWGIRRYQNKDGSLTAAGRKRYYRFPNDTGDLGNILTDKGRKAFKNRKGEWKTNTAGQAAKARHEENQEIQRKRNEEIEKKLIPLFKKSEKYRKELDILNEGKRVEGYRNKDPKVLKRMDDAADLGLRAHEILDHGKQNDKEFINATANNPLEKTTIIDSMGFGDGYTTEQMIKGAKDWFIWEDQTIGYTQMADLINQGYSKDKVKDMRDALRFNPVESHEADDIAFEMDYVDDDFIDACYLIKNAQNKSK
jgi:hypothetical protein